MALTTLEDVQDQLPQVEFSAQSRPTDAAVLAWLDEIEATLFATLANIPPKRWEGQPRCRPRYVLPIDPITSPISARIVVDLVVHAVTSRILRARLLGIGDLTGSGASDAEKYYADRLAWLADPTHPFELPDALVTADPDASCRRPWFIGPLGQMGGGYRPQPIMRQVF